MKGSSDFRRGHAYTEFADSRALGHSQDTARRSVLFENEGGRDAKNDLWAQWHRSARVT